MKSFPFAALLLLFLPTVLLADDALSCSWDKHYKDGYSREVDVAIYFEKDKITQLVFESSIASGKEGGAYFCNYDSSAPDNHTTLAVIPNGVRFTSDVNDPSPTFEVAKIKGSYLITNESTSYYCGFGAEFPEVHLVRGKKKCLVTR